MAACGMVTACGTVVAACVGPRSETTGDQAAAGGCAAMSVKRLQPAQLALQLHTCAAAAPSSLTWQARVQQVLVQLRRVACEQQLKARQLRLQRLQAGQVQPPQRGAARH